MAVNNSYVRPQSEVHQLLSYTISQTNGHGLACIVGSQYDVFRYGKEEVPVISALAESNTVTLPAYLAGTGIVDYVIDTESVHIYAERVMATIGDAVALVAPTNNDYVTLAAPLAEDDSKRYWAVSDSADMGKLVATNYSVSVGDFIVNTATGATAKVTKLIPSTDNPRLYDKIVVNRNIYTIGDAATQVKVGKEYTGDVEVESVTVAENNASLTIAADLEVEVETPQGMFKANISDNQKAFVEFRARVIDASETGIIYLDTVEDIQDKLGAIDVNNELAYACYRALTAAGGRAVAAVRVNEDTAEAFLAAMQKTDSNSQVYGFVPVTTNEECISAVVDYNEQMSTPTVQKWRMTFVGAELDTKKPDVVDAENQLLKGTFYTEGTSKLFQISSMNIDNGFSFTDYVVEDSIVYNDIKYTIKSILAENLVLLTGAPDSITQEVEIKIARTDSAQGNIAQAEKLASSLNSRRVVVVWCDNGRADGVLIHNAYLAAEVAGLASSAEPQAGLTRTEITTIDDAPRMYTRYTQSQLDRVAAHGVLIITQDTVDGTPYIRHQLTTAPDKGILYSEMSCTRNLDNISYAVADQVNTYVGRMNVTPSALALIKSDLDTLWKSYTENSTSPLIGPALVDYYDVSVIQDPVALDRVIVNVTYEIPSPLNRISVYQMTYVAKVSINNNEIN